MNEAQSQFRELLKRILATQEQQQQRLQEVESSLQQPLTDDVNQRRTAGLLRPVGYGLLILGVSNYLNALFPNNFADPVWQLQLIKAWVESTPLPMLGLALVFYGDRRWRSPLEKRLLKPLSWWGLVTAVMLICLVPFGFLSSMQVDVQNVQQINRQLAQRTVQLDQLKTQAQAASTPQEMVALLNRLNPQANVQMVPNLPAVRQQLLTDLDKTTAAAKLQAETAISTSRQTLITNQIRSTIGALVAGIILIRMWWMTYDQ